MYIFSETEVFKHTPQLSRLEKVRNELNKDGEVPGSLGKATWRCKDEVFRREKETENKRKMPVITTGENHSTERHATVSG